MGKRNPQPHCVLNATVRATNDTTITCEISWGDDRFPLFFSCNEGLAADRVGDSLLCSLLLPAMSIGADLRIDAPLSPQLLDNAAHLQDIFIAWWKDLVRVPITSPAIPQSAVRPKEQSAVFFTAGVDSFYSALALQPAPGILTFVEGFDVKLDNKPLLLDIQKHLDACATDLGKSLRVVRTNYRELLRTDSRFPGWERAHGGALASIAHLLDCSCVHVPANFTYRDLFPWGTHPLTDPLWGSDDVALLHHGAAADRVTKCQLLGENATAMRHLRVCWKNSNDSYNCGKCEKCLRTMLNLYVAGALKGCGSLPHTIRPADIAKLRLRGEHDAIFARQNLNGLTSRHPADRKLASALRKALRKAGQSK